jgi:serine/threonine protein kinase
MDHHMSLASSVPRGDAAPAASVHAALPAGTRLGDYRIERTLGQGGYGIVYLATDLALQRPVAIKEYLPIALAGRADDGGIGLREAQHKDAFMRGLQSFLREARLLAQFDHPSLVRVYRFWEEKHTAYMAMSYCDGPTLKAARQQMDRPFDEDWVRERLLLPLLGALETLHRAQCLHRDVSPSNILLGSDGRPMLLDFGSARRVVSDMTQPLTAVLNPSYAAIEQFAESPVLTQGPWTDLYSLAAVAYYAVTGREPVPATVRAVNETALMPMAEVAQLISHSFPALHYGAPFVSAIDHALAVRPADRPQDAQAFRRELLSEHVQPDVTLEGPGLRAVPSPDQITLFGDEAADGAAREPELDEASELAIRAAINTALGDIAQWPSVSQGKGEAPRIEPVIDPPAPRDEQADAAIQAAVAGFPTRQPPAPPQRMTLSVVHPAPAAAPTAAAAPMAEAPAAAAHAPAAAAPAEPVSQAVPAYDTAPDTAPLETAPLFDADEGLSTYDEPPPLQPARRRPVLRWAAAAAVLAALGGTAAWQWQQERNSQAIGDMLSRAPTAAGPAAAPPRPAPAPEAPKVALAAPPSPAAAAAPTTPADTLPAAAPAASAAPPAERTAPQATSATREATTQPAAAEAAAQPAAEPPAAAPAEPAPRPAHTARNKRSSAAHKDKSDKADKPARTATRTAATAAKPATTSDSPRAQCSGRSNFSLYYCMQTQCKQARFSAHPQCQRLREHDEVS